MPMLAFLLRSLTSLAVTFAIVMSLVFVAVGALPGDAAMLRSGIDASAAATDAARRELGLDQPALVRYGRWWGELLRGNLGDSFRERRPVREILAERIPITAALALTAFALSLVVGLGLGVAAGWSPGSVIDRGVLGYTTFALALPEFWFGFVLLLMFAIWWPVLPLIGLPDEGGVLTWMRHLTLPALTLAIPRAAQLARLTRATVLEHRSADWVRTVRAKGAPRSLERRHVAANAAPGLFAPIALEAGGLLTGTIVVEQVFGLPGVGAMLIGAIGARDLPVVQGATILAVVVYVLVNAASDLALAAADPRVRDA